MKSLAITAKVQIQVNEQNQVLLCETMEAYRKACCFVSDYVFRTHDKNVASLNKALYQKIREAYGLKSQMAQSVLRTVVARYKTILENQKKWIKANFKKPQYDLVWNRDYSLNKDTFSVNTLAGRIKLPYWKQGMEDHFGSDRKFGTAKLVWKHGRFFLHIPVTYEVEEHDLSKETYVVGVDRGINFTVATYDSDHVSSFVSGRYIKQKRAKCSALRKNLQMRHTPAARRRIKAIGEREHRWMQDVNHCVSKALVNSYPENTLFVLEDLTGIRTATERVRTPWRYVSVSWSFFDLEQKIVYKAQKRGSTVVHVDPRYTSQRCPICGHTEKSNRNKKTHTFTCKECKYKSNDDRVAAINLYHMGKGYLRNEVPGTIV